MLARVAGNLYWLSRYLERAENSVRLVKTHSNLLLDLPALEEHQGWMPLISINGLNKAFFTQHPLVSEQTVCQYVLVESDNPSSLASIFQGIYFNLRTCRDVLPRATYEAINSVCRFVSRNINNGSAPLTTRNRFLAEVEHRLLAIDAGMNNNMCHDLGYRMMRMGCYLERADMTSRIIDVQSTGLAVDTSGADIVALQDQRWVSVLHSAAAYQMYRQHVRRPVNGEDTLRFLLTSNSLPRSYRFCLDHLEGCAKAVGNNRDISKAVRKLRDRIKPDEFESLAKNPQKLHRFLDNLQLGMLEVGDALTATYFLPEQNS